MIEQEHRVKTFRRYLPSEGKRVEPLIQFWAVRGGLRTIRVKDVVDVS